MIIESFRGGNAQAQDKTPDAPGSRREFHQPNARKGIPVMNKFKPYLIIAVVCLVTIAAVKMFKSSLPASIQGYLPS